MTRRSAFTWGKLFVVASASVLLAQGPSRDAYRAAYQAWREAAPAIEIEAATAGTTLEARAQSTAQAAAAFYDARSAFLSASSSEARPEVLERTAQFTETGLASEAAIQNALGPASQNLTTVTASFAGDTDAAIQRLRQALERERAALEALNGSIAQRKRASDAVFSANGAVEVASSGASAAYREVADLRSKSLEQVRKEASGWKTYYDLLSQGARGVSVSSLSPAPTVAESANVPAGPAGPGVAVPKPYSAKPSITPLPLARYVGGWMFPNDGLYLGAQPEFVDLVVREAEGRVTGTLYVKFILPPGSAGDPYVRFDFQGNLLPQREQVFDLRTSEGASGTIQLIPGSAFNLLEVVFQTAPIENKIRAGNFVLVKR